MRHSIGAVRPHFDVVTAIAGDHNRSFPTLLHTRAEKVEAVRHLQPDQVAVLNGDDANVRWMASQTRARVDTFGLGPGNDVRGFDARLEEGRIAFDVEVEVGGPRVVLRERWLAQQGLWERQGVRASRLIVRPLCNRWAA